MDSAALAAAVFYSGRKSDPNFPQGTMKYFCKLCTFRWFVSFILLWLVIVRLPCHRHRLPVLSSSSSPSFVIVPLFCHRPPVLSLSSSHCHRVIVPLFCHRHRPPVLLSSSSPCSVIVIMSSSPMFCHRHCTPVLSSSSSPAFVIVPLFCDLPPVLSSSSCH